MKFKLPKPHLDFWLMVKEPDVRDYAEAVARAAFEHAAKMLDKAREEAGSSYRDPNSDRWGYMDGQHDLADEMADAISKVEIER